jgi:hypothetical protein
MRWLVRRVLMLWLIMLVLCGTVALVVRLNREPGPLQALGFDVCEGEPCFRGIKVGMDWAEVTKRLPTVNFDGTSFVLPLNTPEIQHVLLQKSTDGTKVAAIVILNTRFERVSPLSPRSIVALYGLPCRIDLFTVNGREERIEMRYPGIVVMYAYEEAPTHLDSRVQLDMPVLGFWIFEAHPEVCNEVAARTGTWHGFASADTYLARNRRALGAR